MRYAVKVRYAQERTIMVDARTPREAAQKAEKVALGFTNVVASKALEARETTAADRPRPEERAP